MIHNKKITKQYHFRSIDAVIKFYVKSILRNEKGPCMHNIHSEIYFLNLTFLKLVNKRIVFNIFNFPLKTRSCYDPHIKVMQNIYIQSENLCTSL